jgi:hypothetical protein
MLEGFSGNQRQETGKIRRERSKAKFRNGKFMVSLTHPPLIFIFFKLAGNCILIYGAQPVTGKILSAKDLTARLVLAGQEVTAMP